MTIDEPRSQRQHGAGQHDIDDEGASDQPAVQRAARGEQVEGEGGDA